MIETVFISDLHLHPEDHAIQKRFNDFISWAEKSVKTIYILGDFFHAWAGDDSINDWSQGIADQLFNLTQKGITLYYMHGNRDFLLGKIFAKRAGWKTLPDPCVIKLGDESILLSHGDRYCTKDIRHQRFRRLTRNVLFKFLFLKFSLKTREGLVNKVRSISLNNPLHLMEQMDVVSEAIVSSMARYRVHVLIHGHTHKPGLTTYQEAGQQLNRYVLSDWDDTPQILCYHNTKGCYFVQDFF